MTAIESLRQSILTSGLLVATFGTSNVYALASSQGRVVANCHKQPSRLFESRRVAAGEIAAVWTARIEKMRQLNPDLQVIITVSPVRHVKDGFVSNSRSKAELLLAAEKIEATVARCSYFPAYELLTDDLRDYRFYASDLVHPSPDAEEYIFGKFCETYVDEAGRRLLREGENLTRLCSHRPLLPGSRAAENHRRHASEAAAAWTREHPGMLTPELYGLD